MKRLMNFILEKVLPHQNHYRLIARHFIRYFDVQSNGAIHFLHFAQHRFVCWFFCKKLLSIYFLGVVTVLIFGILVALVQFDVENQLWNVKVLVFIFFFGYQIGVRWMINDNDRNSINYIIQSLSLSHSLYYICCG